MSKKKINIFLKWLTRRYQFVVYRDGNFEVLKKIRLNKIGAFLSLLALFVVFFAILSLLVVYTPIKYMIPGYPDRQTMALIYENVSRVDSLSEELENREQYLEVIRNVIFDEVPIDQEFVVPVQNLTEEQIKNFNDPTKPRQKIEEKEDIQIVDTKDIMPNLYVPMVGVVMSDFNKSQGHLGVDIAPTGDLMVFATLTGIVIMSSYTLENGYTIIIQHKSNLLSVYKHCERSLVKAGQKIRSGEPIAVYGNSGEDTNGPHLHFELWQNGEPLDPASYIDF